MFNDAYKCIILLLNDSDYYYVIFEKRFVFNISHINVQASKHKQL